MYLSDWKKSNGNFSKNQQNKRFGGGGKVSNNDQTNKMYEVIDKKRFGKRRVWEGEREKTGWY